MRALIVLTIFIGGCASTTITSNATHDNKDVLILSLLVQDHLRKTDERKINLTELLHKDTLDRISNSFKTIVLEYKGGYISVYYEFSESRDTKGIALNDKEKELTSYIGWTERDLKNQYDGEIRLDYGERFYRLKKIIIDGPNN